MPRTMRRMPTMAAGFMAFLSVSGLRALDILFLNPRHQAAQTLTGFFNRMLFTVTEQFLVVLVSALIFRDPTARKTAVLNVLQRGFHTPFDAAINNLRSNAYVAPFRSLRNG